MEGFSDGVMAVAITLLVFNLHAGVRSSVPLATQLRNEWPSFAAYALSFFVIGVIWLNHHFLLGLTEVIDRQLAFYNLLLLLFVVAIPYATATYADYALAGGADARTAVLIYGTVMEGMAISRLLMVRHILRGGLSRIPTPPAEARTLILRFSLAVVAFPVISALAIVIGAPTMLLFHAVLLSFYFGPALRPITGF